MNMNMNKYIMIMKRIMMMLILLGVVDVGTQRWCQYGGRGWRRVVRRATGR